VTESREKRSSAAAAIADHGGPTARGQGVVCEGKVTTSFIGDSRACKCPVNRRGTSVRARPDDGGRTSCPRRGARPASEGSPRGMRELRGWPRGTRCLGKARGLGRRVARMPRVADGQGAARTGAPAWRRCDEARFQRNDFRLGYFELVFPPIFELKCTKR
jgi:hypothetical protein